MRVALVVHGFPPHERTGVENYTASLAAALVRRGAQVVVFAPRRVELPEHATRREERDGVAIEWITLRRDASGPEEMLERPWVTRAFGRFLEHERPDVVHFQHVYKLGVGLLEEARRRGVPVLYTAHDYYPVCHRYTLLRPDLSHCDVRGDAMTCALCDVALGYLNGLEGLGDYQMGVLAEQVGAQRFHALGALLADDPGPAGLDRGDVDAAFDRRLALDARRARAFHAVDRVIAPTSFLAEELVRGGLERERIEVLAYGIEQGDLQGLPPVRPDPSAPVRFAFLGGLSKHKGVHVLLDAFRRLRSPARLSVWGYSSDAPYVERLRAAALASGVHWGGGYERAELPALLAATDVVVVPSIWVENQPLVIREAFAARRPVIASRSGALEESVRHEVDGLLFDSGDAASLAAALERCAGEPGLVERLARGIAPVKSIDEQASELLERYGELAGERAAAASPLPAALAPFLERHARLSALPTRELLARALRGIETLRARLGGEAAAAPALELLGSGLLAGSEAHEELRERADQIAWLESSRAPADEASGAQALEREVAWLRDLLEQRDRELAWRLEGQEQLRALLAAASAEAGAGGAGHAPERPVAHYAFDLVALLAGGSPGGGPPAEDAAELARRLLATARRGPDAAAQAGPDATGATGATGRAEERAELLWRRGEMDRAARLSPRGWVRFLLRRTALGRRLAAWRGNGAAGGGGGA